jgi:hypothetical protein
VYPRDIAQQSIKSEAIFSEEAETAKAQRSRRGREGGKLSTWLCCFAFKKGPMLNHRPIIACLLLISAASAQVIPPKPAAKPSAPKTAAQALAPTTVSFDCDGMSPKDAIASLAKVLGFPLDDGVSDAGTRQAMVTIHAKNRPMMEVVAQLAEQSGMELSPRPPDATSTFCLTRGREWVKGSLYLPTKVDSALFPIVTTTNPDHRPTRAGLLVMGLQTLNEPKVLLCGRKREVRLEEATDDQGRPLERTVTFRPVLPPRPAGNAKDAERRMDEFLIPCGDLTTELLEFVPNPGTKSIKRLRGSVTYLIGLDTVERDISKIVRGGEDALRVGRDSIRFGGFTEKKDEKGHYSFSLSVPRFPMDNGLTFDRSPEFLSMRMILSDVNGLRLYPDSSPDIPSGPATATQLITYSYQFSSAPLRKPGGQPSKLVVRLPSRIEEVTVLFEFTNIAFSMQ